MEKVMIKEDLGRLFEEYIGTIGESVEGYSVSKNNYYYTEATGYKIIQSICDSLNNYYKNDFLISGFKFDGYGHFGPNITTRYGHFDKRSRKSDGVFIYIEFPKEIKQTEYIISLELGKAARYDKYDDKYNKNVLELRRLINLDNDIYSNYYDNIASSIVCYKTDNYSLISDIIEHIKKNYYVPLLYKIGLKDANWNGEEWENFQKSTFGNNYMPIKNIESVPVSKINKEDENLYKASQIQKDIAIKNGFNRLYYGVPGCGKSWYIEHHLKEIVGAIDEEKDIIKIRTVFHPDYSNSDFVGQILPINEADRLVYKPIPGPFAKALKASLENINKKIVLIIEEINRGNASAIFGDIFQLLDRSDQCYIDNNFLNQYAKLKGNELLNNFIREEKGIRLPNNLYIIGTMNTSDQNVYPLDTAFKRRWEMKYWSNQFNENDEIGDMFIPNSNGVTWATFVNKLNDAILNKDSQIMQREDKQLGKYFINESYLIKKSDELIEEKLKDYCYDFTKFEKFRDKVLVYLFDDVTKYNHGSLFLDDINSIDKLMSKNKLEEIIKVPFDNE